MLDRPFFGSDNARNVTALANGAVTLKCTVKNKGNTTVRHCRDYWHEFLINHLWQFRQVSWIRRRDLAILTSNTFVYTTDTRFSVIHIPDSHNWDLRVKSLTEKDSGVRSHLNGAISRVLSFYWLLLCRFTNARWTPTHSKSTCLYISMWWVSISCSIRAAAGGARAKIVSEGNNNLIKFHPFNSRLRCHEWGRVQDR